jgi:tight adherence protein B
MDSVILYIVFVLAFFALIQGFLLFSSDVREETRDTWSKILRPTLADGVSPWLRDILLSAPIRKFDNLVQTCGIRIRTENILFGMMVLAILVMVMLDLYAFVNPLPGLAIGFAVGLGMPLLVLSWMRGRRMAKLTDQLPETLDMMVRSLRAGHPIPVSVGMISKEMADPIGGEFKRVNDAMSFGLDLRDALVKMTERLTTVPELKYVVSAIRIQASSGGNLAEVLGSLATLMREQHKLKMKVKALSAEGRLSGNILAGIPIGVFTFVNILTPGYYTGLKDSPAMTYLLALAAGLVALGIIVVRRISNIRV